MSNLYLIKKVHSSDEFDLIWTKNDEKSFFWPTNEILIIFVNFQNESENAFQAFWAQDIIPKNKNRYTYVVEVIWERSA